MQIRFEEMEWLIRNSLVGITMLFLLVLIMRKKQDREENWAIFYSALWAFLSLLAVNWLCVNWGLWNFLSAPAIRIPYDLLFIWVIAWGVIPTILMKGKHLWIIALILFWVDLAYMPVLESLGILELKSAWIIGEVLIVLAVFVPAYLWARWSLTKTHMGLRSLFQVLCMAFIYCIAIPFVTLLYFPQTSNWTAWYTPYIIQLGIIIVMPAIVAVKDLFDKGRGTPFPYDPTSKLVRTGVYAYIRNPIQWSLTLLFMPLAILYSSPMLLMGILVSLAYTLGVSNPQEFDDMEERFGTEWVTYKRSVPAWRFLWRPTNMPEGIIYFKETCNACSQIRSWFEKRNPVNLEFRHAEDYQGERLFQVTYYDNHGEASTGVKAIASALEHINLACASLGWFMRLPGIMQLLQLIVDSMGYSDGADIPGDKDNLN